MEMDKELFRLNFENFLWVVFILLAVLNIYGDVDDKKFLQTHCSYYKEESHRIFTFTLVVTLLIYLYFFIRNYHKYNAVDYFEKYLYVYYTFKKMRIILWSLLLFNYFDNSLCLILSASLIIFLECFILILGSVIRMIYPSIDKLLNIVDSKYELVHIAARRSKEISRTGYLQMPVSSYKSSKNIGRALEEVTEGLIEIKKGEK